MKKSSVFILGCVAALCLVACGCMSRVGMLYKRQPSQEEMATWDYGPYPDNYKKIIESQPDFQSTSNAKVYIDYQGKPTKTWVADTFGTGFKYGWGGFVTKSSHDIGRIKYQYIIRNGELIVFGPYNEKHWLH